MQQIIEIIKNNKIISIIAIFFIIGMIASSFSNENKETSSNDNKEVGIPTWMIGVWETSPSSEVEFKLKITPNNNPSMYMLGNWMNFDAPMKIYDNNLVFIRNDVEMMFTFDQNKKVIIMGDGNTVLSKR